MDGPHRAPLRSQVLAVARPQVDLAPSFCQKEGRKEVSWEQAGTGQVPFSAPVAPAQEGAATELRSINKVSGRNGFNLHFTYWCLLCYFQYGNLIL